MTGNVLELLIIAFIIGTLFYLIWHAGQKNPVGTGQISTRLSKVEGELHGLNAKVGDLDGLVGDIDARAATKGDVQALDRKLGEHNRKVDKLTGEISALRELTAAKHADLAHTAMQVDRLYEVIVRKGMDA